MLLLRGCAPGEVDVYVNVNCSNRARKHALGAIGGRAHASGLRRRWVKPSLVHQRSLGVCRTSAVVNIHEAKTHLSRLVEDAAAGREIIIAKAGRPVARLAPLEPAVKTKRFGTLKGRFRVPEPDEFNHPLPDHILAPFGIDPAA